MCLSQTKSVIFRLAITGMCFFSVTSFSEMNAKPYRTFVTLNHYTLNQSGKKDGLPSQVQVDLKFPTGQTVSLPSAGSRWTVKDGQVQPIHRTFEIPSDMVQNGAFSFEVQMRRQGAEVMPCKISVTELTRYNRKYTCATDVTWQQKHGISPLDQDKEGIEIRVFTDLKQNASAVTSQLARR